MVMTIEMVGNCIGNGEKLGLLLPMKEDQIPKGTYNKMRMCVAKTRVVQISANHFWGVFISFFINHEL